MRRKRKTWYEITMDGPNVHNSNYWFGGGKWFIPKHDPETGRGINNPPHSNWQHCNTKKAAIKASWRAFDITGQDIRIEQIFWKKGVRYRRTYYLRGK
jgi:hypothetical protein